MFRCDMLISKDSAVSGNHIRRTYSKPRLVLSEAEGCLKAGYSMSYVADSSDDDGITRFEVYLRKEKDNGR